MSNVILCCNDGLGGNLLTAQAAFFVKKTGKNPVLLVPCRDEIFIPFKYLVEDTYQVLQAPETYLKKILNEQIDPDIKPDKFYLVYPDGVYKNKYAFNYDLYNTNPSLIRSTRILTHKFRPQKKHIYVNLNTTTPGYSYSQSSKLISLLGERFPDYTIHCPIINKWAGANIHIEIKDKLSDNIVIYNNPNIIEQIDILFKCQYGIYCDNGFSHIAYNAGQERLILDSRYGFGRNSLPWIVRWFEDIRDHIKIDSLPEDIVDLININLSSPATTLLPRQLVLNNKYEKWDRELLL